MAEIRNSDSPSPYGSSPGPRIPSDDFALFEDLPSDVSSILPDTDDDDNEDDTSIDEDEEDDEDGEGADGEEDEEGYSDDDFDDFDWDMREADFEGVEFLVDAEDHPRMDDYPDFADNDPLALHHALLHLVQDHWGLRPRSPIMDQPHGGAAARTRAPRDQLVQVEVAGQGNVAEAGASARGAPPATGSQRRPRQPPPDVIDLTGDDDVEMPARPNPASQPARSMPQRPSENQRRLRSQTQNAPPRLNRSDDNYVDDQHVIILSSSDDEDRPLRASPRRNAHNSHNSHPHRHNVNNNNNNNNNAGRGARIARFSDQPRQPGPAPAAPAQPENTNHHGRLRPFSQLMQLQNLPFFQFLSNRSIMSNRNPGRDDDLVITGERNIGNLPNHTHTHNHNPAPAHAANPLLGLGPIQLDYAAPHRFPPMPPVGPAGPPGASAGPPKPVHEPPTPARPGFTRDTGEEVVAICPSCDQELAYDPEGDDDTPPTPAKKARSKKAMAEHHFWAVKACGHVYCKRCFDNRRPSSRNPVHVSFRHGDEGGKKLLCAVEDCDSEVTTKAAWVGIFM
ncbi:hypothetical protein F5B21DRAFT_509760 [Xylaria acuta]|nr:hypothetical protein F5B21DRAFT_509760 [Xylaria acuta]